MTRGTIRSVESSSAREIHTIPGSFRNQVSWRLANCRVRVFTSSMVSARERSPRRCSTTWNREIASALEVPVSYFFEGLDGFRLDAVPYLFEREGTN